LLKAILFDIVPIHNPPFSTQLTAMFTANETEEDRKAAKAYFRSRNCLPAGQKRKLEEKEAEEKEEARQDMLEKMEARRRRRESEVEQARWEALVQKERDLTAAAAAEKAAAEKAAAEKAAADAEKAAAEKAAADKAAAEKAAAYESSWGGSQARWIAAVKATLQLRKAEEAAAKTAAAEKAARKAAVRAISESPAVKAELQRQADAEGAIKAMKDKAIEVKAAMKDKAIRQDKAVVKRLKALACEYEAALKAMKAKACKDKKAALEKAKAAAIAMAKVMVPAFVEAKPAKTRQR
jgi:hypothetical protein